MENEKLKIIANEGEKSLIFITEITLSKVSLGLAPEPARGASQNIRVFFAFSDDFRRLSTVIPDPCWDL